MNKQSRGLQVAIALILVLLLGVFLPVRVEAAAASIKISKVATTEKLIALTFDDGCSLSLVRPILKLLTDHGVKCTFFPTGQQAKNNPSGIKAIIAQGSEIGNHSYSHPDFTDLSAAKTKTEIVKTENVIRNITGKAPKKLFRPPYGSCSTTVLKRVGALGYRYTITWSIDTNDWRGRSAAAIKSTVLNNAKPGSIVLMHVGGGAKHTTEALHGIINSLQSKGYKLVTVSRLLKER